MWYAMNDAMHWSMGPLGTLFVVVLVLSSVALAKSISTRCTSAAQARTAIDNPIRRMK